MPGGEQRAPSRRMFSQQTTGAMRKPMKLARSSVEKGMIATIARKPTRQPG